MTVHEHDGPGFDGDSLDQLLGEARWPAASQPTTTRLQQHWEKVWTARRRRETLMRRAAAFTIAATVLGAGTIGWLGLRAKDKSIVELKQQPTTNAQRSTRRIEREPVVTKNPQPIGTADHETRRPTTTVQTAPLDRTRQSNSSSSLPADLAPSRAPNELEQLMLAASERARTRPSVRARIVKSSPRPKPATNLIAKPGGDRRRGAAVAAQRTSPESQIVQSAVRRLISDNKVDVATVAAGLRKSAPISERLLIEKVMRGNESEQRAALCLLAEIGSPLSVGPLLRTAESPALHRAAVETLARVAEPALVSRLAMTEQNPELQQTLFAALLARGEPESLGHYLNFVEIDRTTERALTAARSVKNPPMDLLFAALSEPLEARRIAAARVIGRIDGTATTQRLITMVELGINRHEACIALLSSRGSEAVRYVGAAAERDPTFAAILSGARFYSPSDIPPRS